MAILGIPAGTLIAKLGGKRTMLVSDAARAPLMLTIPILHHTGHLSFPLLLVATFAVGSFTAPYFASSRLVVPEVIGDDEQRVASVGALLSAANQLTQLAGPVLAGVLIAATTPATVLVIDACTYAFSFLTILIVVRAGKRVEATERSKGILAGLRFIAGDSLLGPLTIAACLINFVAQGIVLGVQGIAYFRFDRSAHILGFLFGGFGIGALCGALVAQQLAQKMDLLRLAAIAIIAMPLPLFLLAPGLPWGAAAVVIGSFAFFSPLVNAPVIGMLSVRTPAELRPKVLTAVMTVATLAGPAGFVISGFVLGHVSLGHFFIVLPALLTLGGLGFASVLLRHARGASDDVAVPSIAHG
jgi:predicted MFS family arabinose efflux permease